MPVIYIDNAPYEVAAGQNLLQACLALGFKVPYFCWHPAIGSVGACRQCAVKIFKDEADKQGRIMMACTTPAKEGTRLSIDDPEAIAFRRAVLEWLMTNHPHDCPVCDEGGECHLQDMTVMTGHNYRRHRFKKRTFRNQDLGPLVHHEMNRCIQCYRCVRFYRDYAGGHDLVPLACRNMTYFGRSTDGTLASPFSGNLVEICPTGVFTDKRLRSHYTRKWDLQTAPSICVHCAVGCNTIAGGRAGSLRRILNRYHPEVNRYFLCDRGRYGYEFARGPQRLKAAHERPAGGGELVTIGADEAREAWRTSIAQAQRLIGIGSPRASLEANWALKRLVGAGSFSNGLGAREAASVAAARDLLRTTPAHIASLHDIESADAALVVGEDLTQSAPRVSLALRQAVRTRAAEAESRRRIDMPAWDAACAKIVGSEASHPLYLVTPLPTDLDEIAHEARRAGEQESVTRLHALAHALDSRAPAPESLSAEVGEWAGAVAATLRAAERPLIVCGTTLRSPALLEAAGNAARALARLRPQAMLACVFAECNTLGVGLLDGVSIEALLEDDLPATVILLENDVTRRLSSADWQALRTRAARLIVLDHLDSPSAREADLVLPTATFAETSGTLVSHEGRAQRFYAVFPAAVGLRGAWEWLLDALAAREPDAAHAAPRTLDELRACLHEAIPEWPAAEAGAPALPAEIAQGAPGRSIATLGRPVPRQAHRYSGRTALCAQERVSEPAPPADREAPLSYSMEGFGGRPPAEYITRYWAPSWNSVQALTRFQEEINGPLRGEAPGLRLLGGAAGAAAKAGGDYALLPAPAAGSDDAASYPVVRLEHVFGSEALSARAPGIAALAPEPYAALAPETAARLSARRGDVLAVRPAGGGEPVSLPVLILPGFVAGAVGLPLGLPGMEGLGDPERVALAPVAAVATSASAAHGDGGGAGGPAREESP